MEQQTGPFTATESRLVLGSSPICPMECKTECRTLWQKSAEAFGASDFSRQVFTILECPKCHIGFTEPVPTRETAHLLYEARKSGDFQPDDTPLATKLKAWFARRDIRSFCRGISLPQTPRFLDFGCGNGFFVRAFQQEYPNSQAIGADEHVSPPQLLPESAYFSYQQLGESSGTFDLILCRHVLEHTYDPVGALRFLAKMLSPTGVLVIEVPALETIWKRVFGKWWDGWYAPFHPLHFTQQGLSLVIQEAGLKVIKTGNAEMPKMGRSIRNVLGCEYNAWLFLLGAMLQPAQVLAGKATGTSVCHRIWASR